MKYLIFLLLFCVSCSSTLRVDTKPVEKPKLSIQLPEPLSLDNIEFIVVTRGNVVEVFERLEKRGLSPIIIGLSGNGYKVLALNIDKIKNHIILLNEIIRQYQEYYEKEHE